MVARPIDDHGDEAAPCRHEKCPRCGGCMLSDEEWEEYEEWCRADDEFDGGEFGQLDDPYEGLCTCRFVMNDQEFEDLQDAISRP